MEARRLGRTEMQVPRTSFGEMTIPKVDVEQAIATIETALDLGVNLIHTARAYGKGDSDRRIRGVMEHSREKVYLSSRTPETTCDGIKKAIHQGLEALRADYIDLCDAHDASTQARCDPPMGEGTVPLGGRFSLKTEPAALTKLFASTTLVLAVSMVANALISRPS